MLEAKLQPLDSLRLSTAGMPLPADRGAQQAVQRDLVEGKLLRAVYSNRQLEEVLTDFWYNHFNVFLNKGADRSLVTSYERDMIRPHVLANSKICW